MGGLFVPDRIPVIDQEQLQAFSTLSFQDLAFELVSLYIDASIIPRQDLRRLIDNSYREFQRPDIVNLVPIRGNRDTYVLELFHGPTQSFKDMAMGFLMQVVDYLLGQRRERLNIVLATTGDTGPRRRMGGRRQTAHRLLAALPERNDFPGAGAPDDHIEGG
ncbi:hypothetical protein Q1M64_06390 (plasmid) [Sinorhizobium meliloti]|nr:hypothetical protein Q1M64_06390 [Sinorhizobium meliloti]